MNNWPWEELGLPGYAELPVIRRAYAERLKETRPDENPEGFQRLHSAYQAACRLARRRGTETEHVAESGGSNPNEDGEKLINKEEDTPEPEPMREWDFERLFAEGAVEERARRFQKLWALRRKNQFRYDTWRPTPSRDPAEAALVWVSVVRALSLAEELVSSGAEAPLWNLFCKSELFLYVRNQPDFVFALEDFLRECPDVPEICCQTLFRAYGFEVRPAGREYRPLYQLLEERIPNATTKKQPRPPFDRMRIRLLFMSLLVLAALMANILVDSAVLEGHRREWVRDWMSEDFGCELVQAVDRGWGKAFVLLDSRTGFYCLARWDGSRDVQQGKRGYVTNYSEVRMSRKIAGFAARRNCAIFPERDAGDLAAAAENWGADYLRFPLVGAGEEISALGDLLSAVKAEAWYRALPPEYVLYLCWNDWSFYAYDTRTDDFDATALRRYYERFFGSDLCRIALEETGIAAADMGEAFSLFPESGSVKLENRDFFHVVGVEKKHFKPRYHYFLSDDGTELFCVPTGGKVSGLTLRELYRMNKAEYHIKGFPETLSVFRNAGEAQ
ncbi:MAG: hypothetical protein IKO14_02415 [Oscillibacter sp.]|nr:hypothetical protein [Oscillibacter sp.]